MTSRFDRVRPRGDSAPTPLRPADPTGRRALYSTEARGPLPGTLVLDCSACGAVTALSPVQLVRVLVPSLHVWPLRRYASLLRCPACGHWAWTRLHLQH